MASRRQHLSNDIFNNHSFIYFQFIKQQFFVYLFTDDSVFIKSMADQQSGIAHIAFQSHAVHIQFQPNAWSSRVVTDVDDHSVIQPEHGVFIVAETGVFF